MGGVCAFSNPEPMAPFMDVVAVGEGEELVHELVQAYRAHGHDRERFLDAVAGLGDSVERIAREGKRIGLVGACVSDYPWIGDLLKVIDEAGVEPSISS